MSGMNEVFKERQRLTGYDDLISGLPVSSNNDSKNPQLNSKSGVALAVSAGIAGLNMLSQYLTNRSNQRSQSKENQLAREFQQQMWAQENAYNDPKAQMERLKNAGINPALAYAQGGVMNEAAPVPDAASGVASRGSAPHLDISTQDVLDIQKQQAEIDLLRAQAKNLDSGSDFYDTSSENMRRQWPVIEVSLKKLFEEIELTKSQRKGQDLKNEFDEKSMVDRLHQVWQQAQLTHSQVLLNEKQFEEIGMRLLYQPKLFLAQIRHLNAESSAQEFINDFNNEHKQEIYSRWLSEMGSTDVISELNNALVDSNCPDWLRLTLLVICGASSNITSGIFNLGAAKISSKGRRKS